MTDISYKLYFLFALLIFIIVIVIASLRKVKYFDNCLKHSKDISEQSVVVVINRTWVILLILSILLVASGILVSTILSEILGFLLIALGVGFLLIAILFEAFAYEFDSVGVKFKGVFWNLAYIEYVNISSLLDLYEWFMDSWVLSELTQYYELYGPCEEKFVFHHGLRITKTKKTTQILKHFCPKKFVEPKEKRKIKHKKKRKG